MMGGDGYGRGFVRAFPAAMWPDVTAAASVINDARLAPAAPFTVWVGKDQVAIAYRIHNPEPSVDSRQDLSPAQQTILACLYTRHHDGHVRQRHPLTIIEQAQIWVAPFVRLLGEYVVQINYAIQQFAATSRPFLDVTFRYARSAHTSSTLKRDGRSP